MLEGTTRLVALCALLLSACGSSSSGGGPGDGAVVDAPVTGSVDCNRNCVGVLAANCSVGPADQTECVTVCESIKSGSCASRFQAVMTCAGSFPQYACDANGAVTVTGCETQYDAMIACVGGGGP